MNKYLLWTLLLLSLTTAASGLGCSGEKDAVEEEGGRDKITDQIANAAVKKITTPIQRAQETRKLGDDRLQEIDQVLKKQ